MAEENLVIHKIFSETASKFSKNIALQEKKGGIWRRLAYKEIEDLSQRAAAFLIKEGLKKDEPVALILENRLEWAIIYLGIMYAGLTCVPLDPQLTELELANLILDSTAKAVFSSFDIFAKKIEPNKKLDAIKNIVLDAVDSRHTNFIHFSEVISTQPNKDILPEASPEDIASLIYTSGTTGVPKGVLLTHKNICSNFRSIKKLNIVFVSDNLLSVLPLYHTYAFMVTLIVPLLSGAKVTYFALSFKPGDISSIIKEAQVTILAGVPQIFLVLYKTIHDKIKKIPLFLMPFILPFIRIRLRRRFGRSLRLFVSGGARLEPKIGRYLYRLGLKLIEGYGLTETSPIVTINPPKKIKFGSVGRPIPDVQIMIIDADQFGVGEVLIKGPNVMKGYFKRPELTLDAIRDGWLYSGDLGVIDKDGYLFLSGRKKDVIVLGSGKNIYPEELEEYYSKSPYIKEICILPRLEVRFGHAAESLYAIIVANLEYFRQRNESDIYGKIRWGLENLAQPLAAYKHIMGFTITKDQLPRTPLKKIKRYEVQQQYLEAKISNPDIKETVFSEEDIEILNKDISRKIIDYISGGLNRPVNLNSHLEIDLGLDSLSKVELVLGIESLLSVKIPDEMLYGVSTLKELIKVMLTIVDHAKVPKDEAKISQRDWGQILKELPKEKIIKKIRIESFFLDKLFTWIFKNIFLFIFRIFWSLRIKGRQNLPSHGPYIICANHASFLDGFVIFSSLNFRQSVNIFFLGFAEIFKQPLIRWGVKLARLVPIGPNTHLTESLQTVSFILSHKKIVCIFPEGQRSVDENVGEFKKGVGILIKELDIPAVPVYIRGSHQSWPRTSRFPRPYPIEIIFGEPKQGKDLKARAKGDFPNDYEAIVSGLREEVLALP